jgi:neutral ceramidase
MKNNFRRTLWVPVILILSLSFSFSPSEPMGKITESSILAGTATINITPGTPVPMSGYGDRNDPFKGIHDSLYATAVVFGEGSKRAALITADIIGFSHRFSMETITKIEEATGIQHDHILLTATHTHGGPINKTYSKEVPPEVEAYVAELQEKIIMAVKSAGKQLQPVMIGAGSGTCTMNINRRARLADGSIWLGRNPDGACDHEVSVVRIDDLDRNPVALLVNWPCHGTTGGQENYQITGDWPGAVARFVKNGYDSKVVVHVTAGASGDINPIYGPNDKFGDIDAIGMLLGEEIIRVSDEITTYPNGSIAALQKTVSASGKKRLESRFPDQDLEADDDIEVKLSALKIGNVLFAGISGEVMTEIGMQIKKESPFNNTVVITHCNGSSGYLCTDSAYPEGGYEIMVTKAMPGTEGLITENLLGMIRQFN